MSRRDDEGPREVIGKVTAKPEIAGYSQLGLMVVFLPPAMAVIGAMLVFGFWAAMGMIVMALVYCVLGLAVVLATGKHQTVTEYALKHIDFRTGQQEYVKE